MFIIEGIVILFILILMGVLGICAYSWGEEFWNIDNPLIGIFFIFVGIPMLAVVGICIEWYYNLFF